MEGSRAPEGVGDRESVRVEQDMPGGCGIMSTLAQDRRVQLDTAGTRGRSVRGARHRYRADARARGEASGIGATDKAALLLPQVTLGRRR